MLETATKDLLIDAKAWERLTSEGVREWKGKAMHGQHLRDMMETADVEQTSLAFEHLS